MEEMDFKRAREIDDQYTGAKLLAIAAGTLIAAFTVIYIISGLPARFH
jgi:hypothetical protein